MYYSEVSREHGWPCYFHLFFSIINHLFGTSSVISTFLYSQFLLFVLTTPVTEAVGTGAYGGNRIQAPQQARGGEPGGVEGDGGGNSRRPRQLHEVQDQHE